MCPPILGSRHQSLTFKIQGNMSSYRRSHARRAVSDFADMISTGIDYHKRYSVACTLDAQGQKLREARIDGNVPAAFAAYFKKLGTPSEVVIEFLLELGDRKRGQLWVGVHATQQRSPSVRQRRLPRG